MDSTTTYLVDCTGKVNHIYLSIYLPGVAVYSLENQIILRTIRVGIGPGAGGGGGGIQKIAWDGSVIWDFRYNTNGCLSHHDIEVLPNGNILMIAWEKKTRDEAITAGRNPTFISDIGFYPDHIIEVQPTGSTSGLIVWEWHVWDHLIQDYDASKTNYGIVEDHPELVDINYGISSFSDWLHTNSIDYNEKLDQIMISVCYFNEIWVIDHSTTTTEAADHKGGNSGKGGDLLYRWGNPAAYRKGAISDQKFFGQHDASWIDQDCPGAGHILVFNNGKERPNGMYSSIDEITSPVNEYGVYYRASDSAFGPPQQSGIYTMNPPTSLYAEHFSGAERLRNGNILVCNGLLGQFFEMTTTGEKVWQYSNTSIPTGYVFKIDYIPSDNETENRPPYHPCFPDPTNQTTQISINTDLFWECNDPDNDPLLFDVYFGPSNPPLKVANNQTSLFYDPGILTYSKTYYWKIIAWDPDGLSTKGPLWQFSTLTDFSNLPPNIPNTPTPPHEATTVEVNTTMSWIGGDPNSDDLVTYDVYFQEATTSQQKIASNISTTVVTPELLDYNTSYTWSVVAWDNHGLLTAGPEWSFTTLSTPNTAPEQPHQPTGQTNGKTGKEYVYTTSTHDPEGDKVFYLWDWGDNTTSDWLGPYQSDTPIAVNHQWSSEGSYSIIVKAKDINGHQSPWSDSLPITMPYNYNLLRQFFDWFFQQFPLVFSFFRYLMGY